MHNVHMSALAVTVLLTAQNVSSVTVTVDPNVEYQTITAIGGGEPEDLSAGDAVYAVQELGMSTYRVLYDFDLYEFEKTNDNADPNTFNWAGFKMGAIRKAITDMRALKAAGIKHFFYSVIAIPVWMKVNVPTPQSDVAMWCSGQCGGDIDTTKYEEYAECLTAWVKVLKDSVAELDAVGLQNEPAFNEPYGSCVIKPAQMRDMAKIVIKHFKREGINTKILLGEDVIGGPDAQSYVGLGAIDTALRPYVVSGAVHNYNGDGVTPNSAGAVAWQRMVRVTDRFGIELWMTETSGFADNWSGAMSAAQVMYTSLKYGKLTLWSWRDYPRASNADLSAITKNYSKFIRPGAVQISSTSPDTNVVVLTFRDKNTNSFVGVIINRSLSAASVTLTGNGLPSQLTLHQSTSTKRFENAGTVQTSSFSLLASSVNTLVGTNYAPSVAVDRPVRGSASRTSRSTSLATQSFSLDGKRVTSGREFLRAGVTVKVGADGAISRHAEFTAGSR